MRTTRSAQAAAAMLLAAVWATPAASAPPDTLAQRLKACTPCHGDEGREGRDAYYPRIAGKPELYLYNQLVNFREGRRHYAPMTALLEPLSDAYLRQIAAHFARGAPPRTAPQPVQATPEILAHGERLATLGDKARDLPPCGACHGEALDGRPPAIPGLLGLPRDYVNAQLGAWRDGLRRAAAPDCMATIARRMTPHDVSAVSAWLASRPGVAVHSPVHRPAALPMDCGSAAQAAGAGVTGGPNR